MGYAIGDRVADRYELVAALGEGGMGVVWRARDTRLGRAVAVKLLSASSVGSETARVRLIREARAAAALEHEGIVRVYDVGELPDGGAYLVMELVRGKSLRAELEEKGNLAPGRCVRIIAQAARALQFAHEAGVVHRDVKPDNVMLVECSARDRATRAERAIVVDFGVAKPLATEIVATAETLAGVTNTTLTGAGQIVGTPAYLSPEQARGGPDVGAPTDQFALGVTAFEALAGKRPWTGKSVVEIVASVLRDEPISLRSLVPDLPEAIESVIGRALAKEPADRFSDMNAFADALEEAGAGLSFSLPPQRSATGSLPPSTTAGDGRSPTPPARTPAPVSTHGGQSTTPAPATKSRAGLVAGGFALLLVLGFVFGKSRLGKDATTVEGALSDVVACPQFDVVGIDGGWFGAAAAVLACERVQILRGGLDAKTLTPAELASLPREVAPSFPPAIYNETGQRAKGIEAAKRAGTWLDGKIEKQAETYAVTITLRRADAPIAKGEGHAVEMFEAIRDAMRPVLAALPPPTPAEKESLASGLDVASVDDALALLDVRTAILIEDPISLKAACAALETRTSLAPRVLYLARSSCRRRLRTGPMLEEPPALDESSPAALITTALARGTNGGPAAVRERALRLEAERDRVQLAEGKARLSAAAAEIFNFIGDERAPDVARKAISASPKGVDWRASAWHRLAFSSTGDASFAAAVGAWHPWEPVGQAMWSTLPGGKGKQEVYMLSVSRAYLLSRRGPYESSYGTDLIEHGNIEAARSVAALAQDEVLRVEIMLAEARYGAVLAKVPELIAALPSNDENAALAFRLSHHAVRASVILERPPEFVDALVTRFVLSEPAHVVDGVTPMVSLLNSCLFAPRPVGRRCIERLEQLRRDGKLPTIFGTIETVMQGAARFVADDYAGAIKAWRTLLRSAGWVQGPLREPLAIAFDRAGEPDLGDEVDAPVVALADSTRTADLAWVRAARRAQKRGDVAQAKKLANAVIEKWRYADETVPAIKEMRAILR